MISEADEGNAEDMSEEPTGASTSFGVGQLTRFKVTPSNFAPRTEEHMRFSKDDSDIRGPSLYSKRSLEREETPKASPILTPGSLSKSPLPEVLVALRRVEAEETKQGERSSVGSFTKLTHDSRSHQMDVRQSVRRPTNVKLKTIDEEKAAV